MSSPVDKRDFRRRLDDVLGQRDPQALRTFLIEAGQWQEGNTPADLDRAMWMMIATSPALAALHGEAEQWLLSHGYESEARALLSRRPGGARPQSRPSKPPRGPRPGGMPQGPSGKSSRQPGHPPRSTGHGPDAGRRQEPPSR